MQVPSITPLELRGVEQRFGRRVVLRRVDMRVEAREIVGLIGVNGAGKTTLLSIVAGLLQPTAGQRRLGSSSEDDVGIHHRARMAYVAHTPQLYPRLSARENLDLFARLRGVAGMSVVATDETLERLGLAMVRDQTVGTFSRGMMQRLALARALACRPEVLLLDEPFTALDRDGRELLVRILGEERDRGAATLLCSHEVDMVVSVADRVLLLERGEIAGEVRRAGGRPSDGSFRDRVAALTGGAPDARV
jgi:heme ABC exporter ATP-binding subunit CcmA